MSSSESDSTFVRSPGLFSGGSVLTRLGCHALVFAILWLFSALVAKAGQNESSSPADILRVLALNQKQITDFSGSLETTVAGKPVIHDDVFWRSDCHCFRDDEISGSPKDAQQLHRLVPISRYFDGDDYWLEIRNLIVKTRTRQHPPLTDVFLEASAFNASDIRVSPTNSPAEVTVLERSIIDPQIMIASSHQTVALSNEGEKQEFPTNDLKTIQILKMYDKAWMTHNLNAVRGQIANASSFLPIVMGRMVYYTLVETNQETAMKSTASGDQLTADAVVPSYQKFKEALKTAGINFLPGKTDKQRIEALFDFFKDGFPLHEYLQMAGNELQSDKLNKMNAVATEHPKETIYFECRNNEMFYIDREKIESEIVLALPDGVLDEEKRKTFNSKVIGDATYTVIPQLILSGVVQLQPRQGVHGDNLADLSRNDCNYRNVLERVGRRGDAVALLVRDGNIALARKAGEIAESLSFNAYTKPIEKDDIITFNSAGGLDIKHAAGRQQIEPQPMIPGNSSDGDLEKGKRPQNLKTFSALTSTNAKGPVCFECAGNELLYVDKDRLDDQLAHALSRIRVEDKTGAGFQKILEDAELGDAYHTVILAGILSGQVLLNLRPNLRGIGLAELAAPNNGFSQMLQQLKKNGRPITFLVHDDSEEILKVAIKQAEHFGLTVNVKQLKKGELIAFPLDDIKILEK